jgi:molybdopterin-guanine dinucleotide biosynthesis protein A
VDRRWYSSFVSDDPRGASALGEHVGDPLAAPRAPHLLLIGSTAGPRASAAAADAAVRRLRLATGVVGLVVHPDATAVGGAPDERGASWVFAGDGFTLERIRAPAATTVERCLLEAGAADCFSVRARRGALPAALAALRERVDARCPVVCLARDGRDDVLPGVHVLAGPAVEGSGSSPDEPPRDDVDAVVAAPPAPDRAPIADLSWHEGRVCLRRRATAIVLAGGRSSRMGSDKARLELAGVPLLAALLERLRPHFDELLISARRPDDYLDFGVPVVPDSEPDGGPLVGIVAALGAAQSDVCFICAVDNPALDVDLLGHLLRCSRRHPLVVPRVAGRPEPLFAVYRRELREVAEALLATGERSPRALFAHRPPRWIDRGSSDPVPNVNTTAEWEEHVARRRYDPG